MNSLQLTVTVTQKTVAPSKACYLDGLRLEGTKTFICHSFDIIPLCLRVLDLKGFVDLLWRLL